MEGRGRMTDIYHSMTNRAPGKRQIKWQEHNVLSLIQEEYDEDNDEDFLAAEDPNSSSGSDDEDDDQYVDENSSESNNDGEDGEEKEEPSPDIPSTSKASTGASNKPSTSNSTPAIKKKRITNRKGKKRRRNDISKEAQEEGEAVNAVRKITSRMEKGGNAQALKLRKIQSQVDKTKNKVLKNFVDNGAEICQVCLRGNGSSGKVREILICSNCGTSIHPECYSPNKKCISKSRKMWFCERCLCKSHPNCQLCPTTEGYMKETSNNQWFHIICARYLFRGKLTYTGENDSIIDVSSLSYKLYGAKECILCEDPLMAKTGICIPCDAGMCRNYFHVTCAQRYGLLAQQNSNFYSEVNDVCCPLHSREEIYQPLQKRFFMATALTCLRLSKFEKDRKDSRDRRERSLNEQHEIYVKKKSSRPAILPFDGPPPPRPLHSCASALRNLNEKAKLHFGLNSLNPAICLLTPHEIRKGRHVPPSLSGQFVHHFIDRHLRIQETRERIELDNKLHEELSNHEKSFMGDRGGFQAELMSLENELKSVDEEVSEIDVLDESMKSWVSTNKTTISSINSHLFTMSNQKQRTRTHTLKPLELVARVVEVVPNEPPKQKENPKEEPGPSSASSSLIMSPGAVSTCSDVIEVVNSPVTVVEIHTCRNCGSNTQQHLMLECTACSGWFHIRCCEPPIAVMPKKTKFFVWQCAACDPSEEEADPIIKDETPEISDGSPRFKKRLRTENRKYSPDNYQRPKQKSKTRSSRGDKAAAATTSDEATPTSLKESLKPISPRIELQKLLFDTATSPAPSTPTTSTKKEANKTNPKATDLQQPTTSVSVTSSASNNETTTENGGSSMKSGKLKRKRRGKGKLLTKQGRRLRKPTGVKTSNKRQLEESSSSVVEEVEQSDKGETSEKRTEGAQQDTVENTETISAPTTTAENTDRYERVITISATHVGEAVVVTPPVKDETKYSLPSSSSSTPQNTDIPTATTIQVTSSHTTMEGKSGEEATIQKQEINKSLPPPPMPTTTNKRTRKARKPTRIVAEEPPLVSPPAKRKKGKPIQQRKLVTPTKVEFLSTKVASHSSLIPEPAIDLTLSDPTAKSSSLASKANSWSWPREEVSTSRKSVETAVSSTPDSPIVDLTSSPPTTHCRQSSPMVVSPPHIRTQISIEPTPLPSQLDGPVSTTSNAPSTTSTPQSADESNEKKAPLITADEDVKEAALRKESPLLVQQLAKSPSPPRVVDDSKLQQLAALAALKMEVLDNTTSTTTPETSVADVTTAHTSSTPPSVVEVATAPERIAHPSTLAARKKAMKRKAAEWKAAAKVKSDLIEKEQQQEDEGGQSPHTSADNQKEDSDLRSPEAKRMKTIASIQELRYKGRDSSTTDGSSSSTNNNNRVQETTTPAPNASAQLQVDVDVGWKRVGEIDRTGMTASQILRSAKTPDPNNRSTFRLVQSLSETRADSKRQKLKEKHAVRLASPVILSPPRRPTKLTIQNTAPGILANSTPTPQTITSNNTKETTHIVVANQSYKRVVYTPQGGGSGSIPKEAIRLASMAANSDQLNNCGELQTTASTLLKKSRGRINLQSKKLSIKSTSAAAVVNGGGNGVQFTRTTHGGVILLSPTSGSGGSPVVEPVKSITVIENGSSNQRSQSSPASLENGISEDPPKKLKTTSSVVSTTKPFTSRPVIVNPPRIISFKDGSLTDSSKATTNVIKPRVIATNHKSTPIHGRSTIPCTAAFKQNKKAEAAAGDILLSPITTTISSSNCFSFPTIKKTKTADFTASQTLVTVGSPKVIAPSTNEPPSQQMRNIIRSPLDVTLVSNGDVTTSPAPPTPSSVDDDVAIANNTSPPPIKVIQVERKPDLDSSIIDLCGDDDDDAVMTSPPSISSSEPMSATTGEDVTVIGSNTISSVDYDAPPKAKSTPKKEEMATCAECKKTDSKDDMQACCDCAVIRHFHCWDPPLGNVNRKTKYMKRFFSVQCSECMISKAKKKEAENEIQANNDDDSGGRTRKRSTRKRKTPDLLWQEIQMAQMMKTPKTPKNRTANRSRAKRKSSVNKLSTEQEQPSQVNKLSTEQEQPSQVNKLSTEQEQPSQNSIKNSPSNPTLISSYGNLVANDDTDDVTRASRKPERDGNEDVAALRDHDYLLSSFL